MKNRFDQLAKQVLVAALSGAGHAQASRETSAEPQAVDVWFEPFAESATLPRNLGALRVFAGECCLIEPFHQPPSVDDVSKCIAKRPTARLEEPPPWPSPRCGGRGIIPPYGDVELYLSPASGAPGLLPPAVAAVGGKGAHQSRASPGVPVTSAG